MFVRSFLSLFIIMGLSLAVKAEEENSVYEKNKFIIEAAFLTNKFNYSTQQFIDIFPKIREVARPEELPLFNQASQDVYNATLGFGYNFTDALSLRLSRTLEIDNYFRIRSGLGGFFDPKSRATFSTQIDLRDAVLSYTLFTARDFIDFNITGGLSEFATELRTREYDEEGFIGETLNKDKEIVANYGLNATFNFDSSFAVVLGYQKHDLLEMEKLYLNWQIRF